jgi:outer membrane receptor for ferrienterochelin and colicins
MQRTLALSVVGLSTSLVLFNTQAAEIEASSVTKPVENASKTTPQVTTPPSKNEPIKAPTTVTQKAEVTGAAEAYDARRYDTATKIVVGQEEIQKYGDPTLGDVLKRLPGVTANGGVRMRGLSRGYTQILINGQPAPQGFQIESLTPDMVERIEILRAATAEFSTRAIAGSINIVLKSDAKLPTQAAKPLSTTINSTVSHSSGPGAQVSAFSSGSTTALAYNFGGNLGRNKYSQTSYTTQTASNAAGTPTQLRNSTTDSGNTNDNANLSARVTWSASPTNTLTSQSSVNFGRVSSYSETKTDVRLGTPPPFIQVNGNNDANNLRASSDVVWIRTFAEGAKLNTRVGVSYFKNDVSYNRQQFNTNNELSLISVSDVVTTDKALSANGKFATPFVEGHSIALGWDTGIREYNMDRVQNEKSLLNLNPDNVNTENEATVKRMALFAQDEWDLTSRWSVYAGVRWEGIWTSAGATNLNKINNRSSVASPLIHSLWKLPSSNHQLRSSLTRTYKAPDTNSLIPFLYTSRENTETTPDRQGNPNIKPELAWGWDLSYEHFLPMSGQFSVGTFVRRIKDVTFLQTSLMGERWVSMRANGGVANSRGIEMDAKIPVKLIWKDAPAIEVRANLTRTWSTLDTVPGPNNRLDSQTPFSGNIGMDYRSSTGGKGARVTAGGNFSFMSAGAVRISKTDYSYATPTRSLDIYAAWRFENNDNVRVSLSNALHQTGIKESSYIDESTSRTTRNVSPTTTRVMLMYSTKI